MVVPCPLADPSAYGHLAAFIRHAPEEQRDALWRRIGEAMAQRVGMKPVWLSTAGAGVSWLHVRLDDRPKYYGHGDHIGRMPGKDRSFPQPLPRITDRCPEARRADESTTLTLFPGGIVTAPETADACSQSMVEDPDVLTEVQSTVTARIPVEVRSELINLLRTIQSSDYYWRPTMIGGQLKPANPAVIQRICVELWHCLSR